MVEQINIFRVSMLNSQLRNITDVLDIFEQGGRITSMTVSHEPTQPQARSASMDTSDITYPAQMVEAIKSALADREQQIHDELAALGVTGMSEGRR